MELQTWHDDMRAQMMVRLQHEGRYVEAPITDELLAHTPQQYLDALKQDTVELLCCRWLELYGEKWLPLPSIEGAERTFTQHETIDGEVVVKEIESA